MSNVHAEAIVVRTTEYGEGNLILSLFTRTAGKVSVMARGAKKLKSRYTAVAQLFTHGDYVFYASSSGMGTLNSGDVIRSHHELRIDLDKTAYAAYICELVDKLVPDRDGSAYLFEQTLAALDALSSDKDTQVVAMIFELKMLQHSGYTPTLSACVECGGPPGGDGATGASHGDASAQGADATRGASGPLRFSARLGGMVCAHCARPDWPTTVMTDRGHKLLLTLQAIDLRRLGETNLSAGVKAEAQRAIRSFFDAHVEVRLKSRSFLDQLDKL